MELSMTYATWTEGFTEVIIGVPLASVRSPQDRGLQCRGQCWINLSSWWLELERWDSLGVLFGRGGGSGESWCVCPHLWPVWLDSSYNFISWHLFILGKQLVLLGLGTISAQHPDRGVRLDRCLEPPPLLMGHQVLVHTEASECLCSGCELLLSLTFSALENNFHGLVII